MSNPKSEIGQLLHMCFLGFCLGTMLWFPIGIQLGSLSIVREDQREIGLLKTLPDYTKTLLNKSEELESND